MITDVTDLIAEDHARILRLFATLDDLARDQDRARGRCGHADLAGTWDRLASLLQLHIQAEEEICYVPLLPAIARGGLLRDLTASYDDICEALAEARLHQPGSTAWWQAVTDARAAARMHIRAGTQHVLPLLGRQATDRRSALARQWAAYTTARRRSPPHPGKARPLAAQPVSGTRADRGPQANPDEQRDATDHSRPARPFTSPPAKYHRQLPAIYRQKSQRRAGALVGGCPVSGPLGRRA